MNTEIKFNKNFEIKTPNGFVKFDGIGRKKVSGLVKIDLEDRYTILVDLSHTFFVNGIEIKSTDLVEGELLETVNGLKKIEKIEFIEKECYVYTPLEVKSKNHLYIADKIVNKNCKFLGSSSTLVDSDILEQIVLKEPVTTKWTGLFNIYEEPIPGMFYVLGVDTGKGVGRDYSVIQVLKIRSSTEIEQVAVYRNNQISPQDFAQVCISVSEFYNDAQMMVENNDIGQTVCDTIWYDYECDRLLNFDTDVNKIRKNLELGIRSTRKTKLQANVLLKNYMEKEWITICDQRTVYELSRYEEVRPNVFNAGRDDHDDCFKEDALVKTKNGYIPIVDVKIGDEVLTHKGRWRKVTNLIKKPFDGDWYDIKFKSQLEISCSYNHPIYTSDRKWIMAKDWKDQSCVSVKFPLIKNKKKEIKFEDYFPIGENKNNVFGKKISIVMDDKFAKFLGLFLADGCCHSTSYHHYTMSLAFNKNQKSLIDEMSNYITSLGIKSKIYYNHGKNGCALIFSNKLLHAVLSMCYDDKKEKIVPSYIYDLGDDINYVLDYWLKGDGWITEKKKIGATTSKKLALDMRDISISLNKKASIQKVIKSRINEKDQYHVTIYDEYDKRNEWSVKEISDFEIKHTIFKDKGIPKIIKSHYKGIVYNISVDEDESFVCEGIVVHNCVTSLLWALFFVNTPYYEGFNQGNKQIDTKYRIDGEEDVYDDGDPPPVIFDGEEDFF